MESRLRRESGVAFVEFALVVPIFLVLVLGLVEFGLALNYWLDVTHTANQGARYAAVNLNPVCTGTAPTPCPGSTTFTTWLKQELTGEELKGGALQDTSVPGGAAASVCYFDENNNDKANIGEPISVTITAPYNWLPFLSGNTGVTNVILVGESTQRLEQFPTRLDPPKC